MSDRTIKSFALLILAIIVGCIYIYPDMRLIYELKNDYHGITMTATGDELLYLGMINAVSKGDNLTLSGFDNYEHSGRQPWTFGFFPQLILGFVGKALRISVVQLDILMSFLLPAILFVLVFMLVFRLSGSSFFLSLCGASALLLGYPIFTGRIDILEKVFSLKYSEPLWFLRPISPQANHIMLVISLLVIYEALSSKTRHVALFLISGLFVGFLFYTFIYYWTFVYAGLLILAVIFALRKEFNHVRGISCIFLISLLISIPYWINYWRLIHAINYGTMQYFLNVIYSRRPIISTFHVLLTLFILAMYYRKKHDFSFWYITAFLAGGFICVNQQLITGKTLFPGHWLGYSNKTFFIIALFASLRNFKENNFIQRLIIFRKAGITMITILICVFMFAAFAQQDNFFKLNRDFYIKKQSLAGVLLWLRGHAGKDSVVLTDPYNCFMKKDFPELADILVYTGSFSFLPVSIGTIRSKEEAEDRILIGLAMFGYNSKEAEEFIDYANGMQFLAMRTAVGYGNEKIAKGYAASLIKKFTSLNSAGGFQAKLSRYRLNYIIARKIRVEERGLLRKLPNAAVVFDDGEFIILRVT